MPGNPSDPLNCAFFLNKFSNTFTYAHHNGPATKCHGSQQCQCVRACVCVWGYFCIFALHKLWRLPCMQQSTPNNNSVFSKKGDILYVFGFIEIKYVCSCVWLTPLCSAAGATICWRYTRFAFVGQFY